MPIHFFNNWRSMICCWELFPFYSLCVKAKIKSFQNLIGILWYMFQAVGQCHSWLLPLLGWVFYNIDSPVNIVFTNLRYRECPVRLALCLNSDLVSYRGQIEHDRNEQWHDKLSDIITARVILLNSINIIGWKWSCLKKFLLRGRLGNHVRNVFDFFKKICFKLSHRPANSIKCTVPSLIRDELNDCSNLMQTY